MKNKHIKKSSHKNQQTTRRESKKKTKEYIRMADQSSSRHVQDLSANQVTRGFTRVSSDRQPRYYESSN